MQHESRFLDQELEHDLVYDSLFHSSSRKPLVYEASIRFASHTTDKECPWNFCQPENTDLDCPATVGSRYLQAFVKSANLDCLSTTISSKIRHVNFGGDSRGKQGFET